MMNDDRTWQECVNLAPHYQAIGMATIFLSAKDPIDGFPWEYAIGCQFGGRYRLGMDTSIRFMARHPCGLTFEWWIHLETPEADGRSTYSIDTHTIGRVLACLPLPLRADMHKLLQECASKIAASAATLQERADRQRADAALLWDLCRFAGQHD